MNDKKTSVRTLTMLALLVAMSIVFSRVLSISTGFVRFNLGSLPVLLAAVVFGGMEAALYGAVGLFVTTRVMDTVLYGLDTSKVAYIISDEWKAVSDMLMGDLDRGVTLLQGEGGYTGTAKKVLLVAFKQKEIVDIKRRVHDIDPDAFMIVCDAHDVLGEGFGNYRKEDI